jgi:micrococcal nuclease
MGCWYDKWMKILLTIIFLLTTLFFVSTGEFEVQPDDSEVKLVGAQVVRVVDGDTIVVSIAGREETVRYIGIDTPEPYRDGEPACFSREASARNRTLVAGKLVQLQSDQEDRDRYNRLLRYVYVDDVFVNRVLVEEGYATSLTIAPNTKYATEFRDLERTAQLARFGLWSACE